MNSAEAKRILETALICAGEPLALDQMRELFDDALDSAAVTQLLEELQADWSERGAELVRVASGWRFQSRPELHVYLDRIRPERPPRYSRAVLETLAVIAYRQPATRGDIEDLRGVTINAALIRQLEERGWIEVIGHRETVGRPALYATTRQFLDDLSLQSLEDLPPLPELAEPAVPDWSGALESIGIGTPDSAPHARAEVPDDAHDASRTGTLEPQPQADELATDTAGTEP